MEGKAISRQREAEEGRKDGKEGGEGVESDRIAAGGGFERKKGERAVSSSKRIRGMKGSRLPSVWLLYNKC